MFRINEHPIENVVLPNKPLSNFEIEDAGEKDWFEKLSWCFLERHFAKETKTK